MGSTVDLETKSTAVRQSNQYNAAFLVEIHALRILRMTDANDTIIAVFNVEHEALVAYCRLFRGKTTLAINRIVSIYLCTGRCR
jgi:hypothetical protein